MHKPLVLAPCEQAAMSELYVTTLGLQFSLCILLNSSSAISHRPAFSQALISEL